MLHIISILMYLLYIFTCIYKVCLSVYSCLLAGWSKLWNMFGIVIVKYYVNSKLCEINQII